MISARLLKSAERKSLQMGKVVGSKCRLYPAVRVGRRFLNNAFRSCVGIPDRSTFSVHWHLLPQEMNGLDKKERRLRKGQIESRFNFQESVRKIEMRVTLKAIHQEVK
ncbi:hypothetical protein CEXT_695081 [Caerostris extrusa]|uniref:Ribosomal protein S10 n=1 Tax=Caerostris extrusa TaxID=172846 RepID=A0AAV4X5R0_CAEEX|nr:hypothetical protein CEXT_695081 [Caerostris extrusa]